MCVIIYIPKGETISEEEIKKAWRTNPHGAGFCYRANGEVFYNRGFMQVNKFYNAIKNRISKYDLVLHFRISTSSAVNKVQTHPYNKGAITKIKGRTTNPVICMNGVITGQQEYKGKNDTMSYISDNKEVFKLFKVSEDNQQLLNLIASATGAKWAVMTPHNVLVSDEFTEYKGKFYSNKNHLKTYTTYYTSKPRTCNLSKSGKNPPLSKPVRKLLKKNPSLKREIEEYKTNNCKNNLCNNCLYCLADCTSQWDIYNKLDYGY